ncbi:MAG: hypothetical protein ACKOAY_09155 [Haliscomenobacter sp.]
MKRKILLLTAGILALGFSLRSQDTTAMAIGQWRSLLPFRAGTFVTQSRDKIYYATELAVLSLDKSDFSVSFLTRENGLSQVGIRLIRYNSFSQQLMVVYHNSVIDFIDASGKTTSLHQIQNFRNFIGEKFIYDVFVANDTAVYIAANYGISRLNPRKAEFSFTAFSGLDVYSVTTHAQYIYAATEAGIFRIAQQAANPQNFGNWEFMGKTLGFPSSYRSRAITVYKNQLFADIDNGLYRLDAAGPVFIHRENGFNLQSLSGDGEKLFAGFRCAGSSCSNGKVCYFDTAGYQGAVAPNCCGQPNYVIEDERGRIWFGDNYRDFRYLDRVADPQCHTLTFNSPYSSNNYALTVSDGQLWLASGGVDQTFSYLFLDHGFSSYINGFWTIYNRNNRVELRGENPSDSNDDLLDILTIAIHPENKKVYAGSFFEGLLEKNEDKFTLYNEKNSSLNNVVGDAQRTRVSGLAFDEQNRLWVANHLAERPISVLLEDGKTWKSFQPGCRETQLHQVVIDANGYKWFVSSSSGSGLLVFDEGDINTPADDRCRLINTSNSNLPTNSVHCLAADLEGDIWAGTAQGIIIFECGASVFDDSRCQGTLRPVEQDGYYEYLLNTEDVQAIAVDGGNRKWVGTRNGVFVLSANGEKQLAHYTTENSPLLSNSINAIAIDQQEGIVYIGGENGINSLQTDAIAGERYHLAKLDIFPNPVYSDYQGPIAIRGVSRDAVVKITDIQGNLVFETKAQGGQAIWDGNDYLGRRVQTGVYLVFSASNPREAGFAAPTSAVGRILVQH